MGNCLSAQGGGSREEACVQPQEAHGPPKIHQASGQDLTALLSSLHKEQQAPLTLASLERQLANGPPILVARTARTPATTEAISHSTDNAVSKSTKQHARLPGVVDPYFDMVWRLHKVAAPEGGSKASSDGFAKLEALRRQGSNHVDMHYPGPSHADPAHMLTFSYANPALIEAFGGAAKVMRWVDAQISQNPLLLWQLSRSGEGEVYHHCLTCQNVQGGWLPVSVVLYRTQDTGPVLIIGLHCQGKDGSMSCKPGEGLLQPQQQRQQQKQPKLWESTHTRESKSLDQSALDQKAPAGPVGPESPHHQQEYLHLAMAHLPFAVTLIDSSSQVFWQNGRSALLLGLLSGDNNKARNLRQSLQRMFTLDQQALESLIHALEDGQAWSGLVQVPSEGEVEPSTLENAGNARMEGIQTLAPSAEDLQKSTASATHSAKCLGSLDQGRETPDESHLKSGKEGHALCQEAGPVAVAAGLADEQRASAADDIPCLAAQTSAAGFSFPENLTGAPDNAVPAELRMPGVPDGSKADTLMLRAFSANKDGRKSTVRVELSADSTASDPQYQATPFARALQRCASSFALPPSFKKHWQQSERLASDPLPKALWLQKGRGPSQQQSAPLQRLALRNSVESPVAGYSAKDDPLRANSSSSASFRRSSARHSVHTSGMLLEQDTVLSGASRALRMSSSQYAVGSLNYLAQSQEHAFSGATWSAAQFPPAHYFDSIPEGRQEREAQNSLSSGMPKSREVDTRAHNKALGTIFDNPGCRIAQASKDGSSKVPQRRQSRPALQLPYCAGTASGSQPERKAGGVDLQLSDKSAQKGCEGEGFSSRDAHHADCLRNSPLQSQHSNPVCANKSSSGLPEAHLNEGRRHRDDLHATSASAPLLRQISVPDIEEEHEEPPRTSWHFLEAFTIKRPDGGKVTVLTNQDVTSWVNSQMSLKQILDVEHKILEDIFPRHVLESQVAAGAEARTGKSTESGFNSSPSPMLSKRGSNQSQAWSNDKDCRSHRSSRLGCMTSDTSPASRSEILFNDATHKLRSQKGSPFDSGNSSPLPQLLKETQNQRYLGPQRGLLSERIRSMNSSAKSSQPHHALSSASTGSTEEASGILYFLGKASSADHGHHSPCNDDLIAQGAAQGTIVLDTPAVLERAQLESHEQNRRQQVARMASLEQAKQPSSGLANVQLPTGPSSPNKDQLKNVQAPPKQASSCSTAHIANNSHSRLQIALTSNTGTDLSGSQGSSAVPRDPGPPAMLGGMGRHHENVTVMFADIKNFTAMSRAISSAEVMHFLHTLYSRFDALVDSMEELGLYKIETIGDCYMCAAGLLTRGADGTMVLWDGDGSPVHHLFTLAREMLEVARTTEMPASGGQPVVLRIGMHTGPVTSGIAGRKCPRFCLFGETVNFSARMESTCEPGMVHVSQATWEALGPPDLAADRHWSRSPGVKAKGIGFVQTYLWSPIPKNEMNGKHSRTGQDTCEPCHMGGPGLTGPRS